MIFKSPAVLLVPVLVVSGPLPLHLAGQESPPNAQAKITAGSLHSEGVTTLTDLISISITYPLISIWFGVSIIFMIPASLKASRWFL